MANKHLLKNPELVQYSQQFLQIKRDVIALEKNLLENSFNWKPSKEGWSIGQCFDHLNRTGYPLVPLIQAALTKSRTKDWYAEGPFKYSYLGKIWARQMDKTNTRKIKSPKLYVPDVTVSFETAVNKLVLLQDHLMECVKISDGIDLKKTIVCSPANRLIRLSLGIWFQSTIAHQNRHLEQANRIYNLYQNHQKGDHS